MTERYWWPFATGTLADSAFDAESAVLSSCNPVFDEDAAAVADRWILSALKAGLPRIVEKDTLPGLCHLFVGWGNAIYQGARISEMLAGFVHEGPEGSFIYQAHGEGDFHPWQTFCYLLMGGVRPDDELVAGATLRTIAGNSRVIHTQAMEDVGHLLFGLAHLQLDDGLVFEFDGGDGSVLSLDVYDVIRNAIQAHRYGNFKVCRKFHLTEGLCATTALMPGLAALRPIAQGFFAGQMDLLVLVHRILRMAFDEVDVSDGGELEALRSLLLMGRLFENHLYYVGHLTELACFGLRLGFEMTPLQRSAAAGCLNLCNALIGRFAVGLAHAELLLPFSHYRRGMSLWRSASNGLPASLSDFTANFDVVQALPADEPAAISPAFSFAEDAERPSARLQEVLRLFAEEHPSLPQPRGSMKHFRRLIPTGWDRRLHYEFLDYGHALGAELHFESRQLVGLLGSVRDDVAKSGGPASSGRLVEKEFNGGAAAKLAYVFPADAPPEEIVKGMQALIAATHDKLSTAIVAA